MTYLDRLLVVLVFCLLIGSFANAQRGGMVQLNNEQILVAAEIEKEIEIVDGDTLWMGNHQIRLYGIDALEPKQDCLLANRDRGYCHESASELLRTYSRHPEFRCEFRVKDGENKPWVRYGRYVASCYAGDVDVNRELVKQGWAYADRYHGESFEGAEAFAKSKSLGIHATDHQIPWEWRKMQREDDDGCACK